MRFEEYQQRKRSLEEQLQADLELIYGGHRAKLQALEMLWLTPEATSQAETQPAETQAAETQAAETQAPPQTLLTTSVQDEIEALLPRLQDRFDKDDVIRALGWEPNRATLYRALGHLRVRNRIAVEIPGEGRKATRYRKVGGG